MIGTPRSLAALRWSPARMPRPPEYCGSTAVMPNSGREVGDRRGASLRRARLLVPAVAGQVAARGRRAPLAAGSRKPSSPASSSSRARPTAPRSRTGSWPRRLPAARGRRPRRRPGSRGCQDHRRLPASSPSAAQRLGQDRADGESSDRTHRQDGSAILERSNRRPRLTRRLRVTRQRRRGVVPGMTSTLAAARPPAHRRACRSGPADRHPGPRPQPSSRRSRRAPAAGRTPADRRRRLDARRPRRRPRRPRRARHRARRPPPSGARPRALGASTLALEPVRHPVLDPAGRRLLGRATSRDAGGRRPAWLRRNAAVFGLTAAQVDGLELVNNQKLAAERRPRGAVPPAASAT